MWLRKKKEAVDASERLDLMLLALKMEDGGHEPKWPVL